MNNNKENELLWIKLFFKWLSDFTLTLIEDIWARRIIAIGICGFGIMLIYKVLILLNLIK